MPLLFLDTEFTAFGPGAELLSVAIVSEDGKDEFYAERNDYSQNLCSLFVIDHVLPLFGQHPEAVCGIAEMRYRLREYLERFPPFMKIASDLNKDLALMRALLGEPWPVNIERERLRLENIEGLNEQLDQLQPECDPQRHHALHDARALRAAFLALQSRK